MNVAADDEHVVAFLCDEGSSREGFRYYSFAHRRLKDLGPGESVELPVDVQNAAGRLDSPGRYTIVVRLVALGLSAPDAVLTVV